MVPAGDLEASRLLRAPVIPPGAETPSRKNKTVRLSDEEIDFLTGDPQDPG
jgi:hypothetical protein